VKPASGASNTCEGHCPRCDQNLNANIVASHPERWFDEGALVGATVNFRILKCLGCETVYFQKESWPDEQFLGEHKIHGPHVTHWPPPSAPDWVRQLDDRRLRNLLREVYGAVNAGHRVLAAIGTRTALDCAMVLNGAKETSDFKGKRKELRDKGVIGEHEFETLFKLVDAGSAAAHRAWMPKPEELTTLIDGMESFLHRTLVLKSAVNAIDTPPRVPRPKKSRGSPEN
jgi:hypothetical protein